MAPMVDLTDLTNYRMSQPNIRQSNNTRNVNKPDLSQCASDTNFCVKPEYCICKIMRPLLLFVQVFGISPVKQEIRQCKLIYSWRTIFPFINMFWSLISVMAGIVFFPIFLSRLTKTFNTTTIYAYGLSVTFQMLTVFVLFFSGNSNAYWLVIAWKKLHGIMDELAEPRFKEAKILTYFPPIYLTLELISIFVLPYPSSSSNPLGSQARTILSISVFFLQFIPDILAMAYCVILWIVGTCFNIINERVSEIFKVHDLNKTDERFAALQLLKIRIMHENLCIASSFVQRSFGYQMLGLLLGSVATIITGIYSVTLNLQGAVPGGSILRPIYITVVSASRSLIIICICQRTLNSANRPVNILNKFGGDVRSRNLNTQINKFQNKLGTSPLRLRCCNIFDMGTPLLASGAMDIITYLLILVQFNQIDNS